MIKSWVFGLFLFLLTGLTAQTLQIPADAGTYSSFNMEYTATPAKVGTGRMLFGVQLPVGWELRDKNDFSIAYSGKDTVSGIFAFCQFYTDQLQYKYPASEGYYWWGARATDKVSLISSLQVTARMNILTDGKTGPVNLKFAMGDDYFNLLKIYGISESTIQITAENEFPRPVERNWQEINGGWNSHYFSDKDYDSYFQRYFGWTGGDIAVSVPLPDGRSVWLWGDFHSGVVTADRTRTNEFHQFPRNMIMVQDKENFSGFRMYTSYGIGKIKAPIVYKDEKGADVASDKQWYWPMGGIIYYRNGVPELQLILEHTVIADGEPGWNMRAVSCDVAVFSLPDLQLERVVKDLYVGGIPFANSMLKDDDGAVYLYGEKGYGICGNASFSARSQSGDLTAPWEFYDGKNKNWVDQVYWEDQTDWLDYKLIDAPVILFKDGGKYYALEQPGCFGRNTYIHEAATAVGPFTNRRLVGSLPAEISEGDYFCYIPAIHQQYSKEGELFYCVSKNTRLGLDKWFNWPGSGDIYMPHFFRVENWRDKLNIVENDITDNGGTISTENVALTDNKSETIFAVQTANGKYSVQYESTQALFARRYTLTSAADSPQKDPLHWQLLGSMDGNQWEILDERYNVEFKERNQTISFVVSKDKAMKFFRLDVLAEKNSIDLQIAEWQLFGEYSRQPNRLSKVAEEKFLLYPNPVRNHLNLQSLDGPIQNVVVTDIFGREILNSRPETGKVQLSATAWSAGVYMVRCLTSRGLSVRTVIKS